MDEKELLIQKKKAEISKQQNFIAHNMTWIYPVDIVLGVTFIIFGIVMAAEFTYFVAAGILIIISGLVCSVFGIVFLPLYRKRRANAPETIHRLEEEISELERQSSETSKKKEVADQSASIDLLAKYKNLLESGVITQEEFDAKKKELLDL